VQGIALAVFGGVVVLFILLGAAIDMAARIEYAEGAFPKLKQWTESKKWHRTLLIGTLLFYGGTLYELLKQPEEKVQFRIPTPVAPNVVIQKRIIKTTGSGRLDRDMNDQQSNHLYQALKSYVDMPNRNRPAAVTLVTAYPCDRESNHLFWRFNKVFGDARWTVTQAGGWPTKSMKLQGRTINQLPIGIWILTDDQYLRYFVWNSLREAGLDSDNSFTMNELPDAYKGLVIVIGYKDVPF
jgi:hypothetical protein